MGKVITDRTAAETLEPLVLNPESVNTYDDAAILSPKELRQGDNVIFDNGMIEKISGTTKENSDSPGNNPVYALHRAYGNTTEKDTLRLSGGVLKKTHGAFATSLLTGLASKITPFVNIRGKAYGVNETDGLIRHDPKLGTAVKAAIASPQHRKKIGFFEDDETWYASGDGTSVADTAIYAPEEWSGKAVQGLKLSTTAGSNTVYSSANIAATTLSLFESGKASSDTDDYICFKTFHRIRNNITAIQVTFLVDDSNYYYVNLYPKDFSEGDYQWTDWKIKKGAFTKLSSPTWATCVFARVAVFSNANGIAVVTFDYLHMRISPPKPRTLRTQIFDCENDSEETWSGDGALSHVQAKTGVRSILLAGTVGGAARTATCALTTGLDLSKWTHGIIKRRPRESVWAYIARLLLESRSYINSPTTDEIVFDLYCTDITGLADAAFTLKIGQDSSNYFLGTWANKAAIGMTGNNQWIEVRIKKSAFITGAGTPVWTSGIDYISFTTPTFTGATKYLHIDNLHMEQFKSAKKIADFESDETWTPSLAGYAAQMADTRGVTEGAQCLAIGANPVAYTSTFESAATCDISTADLTAWDDASASDTDDYICFDLSVPFGNWVTGGVKYLELWFDNNSLATFANAYKVRIEKEQIPGGYQTYGGKGTIRIRKNVFEQVGTTGGWNTIGAIKFIGACYGYGSLLIDNLRMERNIGINGTYYYKYCYMVGDVPSCLSEISDPVNSFGMSNLISNVSVSSDNRVTARKIFRLGGKYPETWMYVCTLGDNATTAFIDEMDDDDLIEPLGDDIPAGNVNSVPGNNLAYDAKEDTLLIWGDPANKNCVRKSNPAYFLSVSELNYRQFPSEVMSVVPWYGQYFIFYRHRIQKIVGDFLTGELVDLPINVGACSYWAVGKPQHGMIPFVSNTGPYIFDGYKATPIGRRVKNYFKGRESYLSTVNVGFSKDALYIACKDKTGTPTYNDTVLRYAVTEGDWQTGKWSVMPDWNVNVWCNFDGLDDTNQFWYGDSVTGNVYSLDSATYLFDTADIYSTLLFPWISYPESDIALVRVEIKAMGNASSWITLSFYKNGSGTIVSTGIVTVDTTWKTYNFGSKNIHNIVRGNSISFKIQSGGAGLYFKIKEIIIYLEKLPKRLTLNDVSVIAS